MFRKSRLNAHIVGHSRGMDGVLKINVDEEIKELTQIVEIGTDGPIVSIQVVK